MYIPVTFDPVIKQHTMKAMLFQALTALVIPFALVAQGQQNVHEWPATDPTVPADRPAVVKHSQPVEYGLREILQLQPVIYHWKDAYDVPHTEMGFESKDMDDVISDAAKTNQNVSNADMVPVTVAALQELYQLVKLQQQTIEYLRAENADLKNRVEKLENPGQPVKF
jgi:hypothetical protein